MKRIISIAIAILLGFVAHAQIITTIAGGGTGGLGDGGPAIACQFNNPIGIAISPDGTIYIADRSNNRLRKINAAGTITTIAGTGVPGYSGDGGPATLARLNMPYGVVLDGAGNIYISESVNCCVRKINPAGIISTIAGNGSVGYSGDGAAATAAQLNIPGLIAVDASGNIFIPDIDNHRIRKVNTAGIITTIAGTGTSGFSGDAGNATNAKLANPHTVVLDAIGNIYVTDYNNDCVRKINTSGIISTMVGSGTSGYNGDNIAATTAKLNHPLSLAFDGAGNLYVGDNANYRIRKINASNIITTIAGTGASGATGDGGPATDAKFQGITGISTDAYGNIYIADAITERIRRISAPSFIGNIIQSETSMNVYPIPCNGEFTVNIPSIKNEQVQFVMLNHIGRVMLKQNITANTPTPVKVDVPTGIYILSAITSQGILNKKLLITKYY